jgi:predicted AAA+ superfamily ATPase
MFGRIEDLQHLEGLLSRHPVAGIVGARQIGKTTLARALEDLGRDRLDVLHAGDETFQLAENIRAVVAARLRSDIDPL